MFADTPLPNAEDILSSEEATGFVAIVMENIVVLGTIAAMALIVAYLTALSRRRDAAMRRKMKNELRADAGQYAGLLSNSTPCDARALHLWHKPC